jgi:hypothetical protein
MINPSTSTISTEVVQGITGITIDMGLLDASPFDIDDYTVAKILPDTESIDSRLYQDFPYLYHAHGTVEDPDRLGMIIHLLT